MSAAVAANAYKSVFGARFREQLQYRGAAAAGFVTQLFWGLIRVMILEAFFHSSALQPMTLTQVITYTWLGQAFFALIPFNADADVRNMIRTGTVAYEMLRPVDVYGFWYCRALAARVTPVMLRCVPIFVLAGLFFGLKPPSSIACAAAWVVAMVGAACISAAVATLMTISLLWTAAGDGINRLFPMIAMTLAGMIIPLSFLPAACQPVLNALPFRYMYDVPFRIYMGHIPESMWAANLLGEAVWLMAIIGIGRFCLNRGMNRLVVQGG